MSTKLLDAVWNHSRVGGSELLVLLCIADNISEEDGGYIPPLEYIAYKSRLSIDEAKATLKSLWGKNELIITGDVDHISNKTWVRFPSYLFLSKTTTEPLLLPRKIARDTRLVYFISGENGNIKIGITQDIVKRMESLQCGSSAKLKLLAVARGGAKYEKELHERFSQARVRGEWFEPVPELLDLINLYGEQDG